GKNTKHKTRAWGLGRKRLAAALELAHQDRVPTHIKKASKRPSAFFLFRPTPQALRLRLIWPKPHALPWRLIWPKPHAPSPTPSLQFLSPNVAFLLTTLAGS